LKLQDGRTCFRVKSEYNENWIKQARKLGGTWQPSDTEWSFDILYKERVKAVLIKIFGFDGESPIQTVTIRHKVPAILDQEKEYVAYGRTLVWRSSRDYQVSTGKDVIIHSGDFRSSGGSAKYPAIGYWDGDVILEIRNVPVSLLDGYCAIVQEKDTLLVNYNLDSVSTEALIEEIKRRGGYVGFRKSKTNQKRKLEW
jgi:aryl carrier-like protein